MRLDYEDMVGLVDRLKQRASIDLSGFVLSW